MSYSCFHLQVFAFFVVFLCGITVAASQCIFMPQLQDKGNQCSWMRQIDPQTEHHTFQHLSLLALALAQGCLQGGYISAHFEQVWAENCSLLRDSLPQTFNNWIIYSLFVWEITSASYKVCLVRKRTTIWEPQHPQSLVLLTIVDILFMCNHCYFSLLPVFVR